VTPQRGSELWQKEEAKVESARERTMKEWRCKVVPIRLLGKSYIVFKVCIEPNLGVRFPKTGWIVFFTWEHAFFLPKWCHIGIILILIFFGLGP
jgi:hypothetical protein